MMSRWLLGVPTVPLLDFYSPAFLSSPHPLRCLHLWASLRRRRMLPIRLLAGGLRRSLARGKARSIGSTQNLELQFVEDVAEACPAVLEVGLTEPGPPHEEVVGVPDVQELVQRRLIICDAHSLHVLDQEDPTVPLVLLLGTWRVVTGERELVERALALGLCIPRVPQLLQEQSDAVGHPVLSLSDRVEVQNARHLPVCASQLLLLAEKGIANHCKAPVHPLTDGDQDEVLGEDIDVLDPGKDISELSGAVGEVQVFLRQLGVEVGVEDVEALSRLGAHPQGNVPAPEVDQAVVKKLSVVESLDVGES
eukprot:755803-Hanusia_phi.AAC.2